ncbi:uncharacterized protein LOC131686301 isoform X1 [Topomyia yanbarensis]|uniref:uncharacterized protein LOC131686301 isoform X1 n=2 Tax=Topomyia yanbarensis TaxID=2498891 RepID=UPI00273BC638|nr:uncharacterized protein LOC131686301 isoform X1 [Topomyia yanbarensis]XP_058826522.1 uncharacterized protein LOC131686301 isoform X1 [Topomyia yanbarensis]
MAEISPSGTQTGGGANATQGPPVPAVRTSSLQPVPPPRTTTQAIVHHSAPSQQQHQQQQQQNHHLQQYVSQQSQQQQQHHHPGVQHPPPPPPSQSSIPPNTNQIFATTGLLSGPRLVVLHRHNGDFGFTLRHFIVYPPPEATSDPNAGRLAAAAGMPNFAQPMDTVFVKKVHPNSPAFLAGLQEGDRLLAVNGISVASLPYAQVVATIQQTPKTLTLQVVPKNYDLLQTYFSETAYNPETNQRPQPQQLFLPKAASTPNSRTAGVKRVLTDVQEKQESLYSTLQEIVGNAAVPTSAAATSNANKAIYAEVSKVRSPPVAAEAPSNLPMPVLQQRSNNPLVFDFDPIKQQQYLAQQQHQQQLQQQQQKYLQQGKDNDSISSYDSVKSTATLSANDVLMGGGDSAIMSRQRKIFEKKEEFLLYPHSALQREFYGRPKRLEKPVWPPPAGTTNQPQQLMPVITAATNEQDSLATKPTKASFGTQTTKAAAATIAANSSNPANSREQRTTHLSTIREQFFSGINGTGSVPQQPQHPSELGFTVSPKSAPPSLTIQREQQQQQLLLQQQNQLSGSQSALPLSPQSMHVVSEKAKLFESGRPLSPDGIDRAELYKSELSRMNTKQVVPNVAVRRKEFERKAESTGWRRSTEEKPRSISSDSDSRRTPVRVRSLSVESSSIKDPTLLYNDSVTSSDDQQLVIGSGPSPGSCTLLRQRPVRENSYRNALRSSTAFWLQGPATSGSFVPPPSALSPPPVPAPPPPASAPASTTHGPASFPFTNSKSPPAPSTSLTLGIAPVAPARTYAATHRLHPLTEEQFRLRMLHRNQTIVEVHSQPSSGIGGALSIANSSNSSSISDDGGGGGDGDVDMMSSVPSFSSSPVMISPSITTGGTSTSVAPVAMAASGSGPPVNAAAAAPSTAAVRPTTLNLCSDSSQVVLRQKQQKQQQQQKNATLTIEEDERKTRRISYLRATAHDNMFQMESDPSDSSPMSLPADTPDTEPEAICDQQPQHQQQQQQLQQSQSIAGGDPPPVGQLHHQQVPQQLKSAYRPWRRPRLTGDIQPLRRLFDESPPIINLPPILEQPATPTCGGGSVMDLSKLPSASITDSDGEGESIAGTPSPVPRAKATALALQKRSSSLTTATTLTDQLRGSSLGNLHVITTTSASGVVTRSYFFAQSHSAKSKALAHFRDSPADPSVPVQREGELNIKVTLIDGKRSQDRSWRTVHAELRGTRLKLTLIRDGKSSSQSPEPSGIIDLTNFHVAEGNYTKRKNVFKLTTVSYHHQQHPHQQQQQQQYHPMNAAQSHQHLALHHTQSAAGGLVGLAGTGPSSASSSAATSLYKGYERELLIQADSHNDMRLWMDSLRTVCRSSQYLNSSDYINNFGGQQAEPQRVAALTSVQSTTSNDEFSPVLSAKSHRKYALGSRSPSGQSPVTKSRKTPQHNSAAVLTPAAIANANSHHSGKESSDKETGSPKSKTWKGIVARQFRKMQGQPGSPGAQHPEMLLPDGASINAPLPLCPPSDENPYVPLLLAKCTGIVETKGLGVIGIYRIPGNTAAISQLTDQVNRGMDEVTLRDPKWEDVNVVSSLLKSFIRNLPEPLLPNELYHSFICADKLSGQARLIELKQLLKRIPTYNYETLKHLMRHLHAVSTNALVNLMDPRNLAIVFGPSVVRSVNESLETAVKDMKHQCQIVEVLITHYQYFFEDDLLPIVVEKQSTTTVDSGLDVPSTSLLLDNVSKIEPFRESSKESSSHFVAQIVQAANRKIRRTAQRKSTMSSTTPDTLSLDSTTSAESKERATSHKTTHQNNHRYLHPSSAEAAAAAPRNGNHHDGTSGSGSQSDPVAALLAAAPRGAAAPTTTIVGSDDGQKENLVHQHHHHHHHYYHHHSGGSGSGDSRHHSSQSNDDNSSVLNRSSEEDSNDSAFADNGSMSLKTITITLDNKLRSLRTSSIDSDRDVAETTLESDCDNSSSCYSTATPGDPNPTPTRRSAHHSRPLTLGENIPYADESPERPLIQPRSKPLRQHSNSNGNFPKSSDTSNSNSNLVNNNNNNTSNASTHDDSVKSVQSLDSGGGATINSGSANDSCVTLVNEPPDEDEEDKVNNISISSDDTDTSTTSNPREKLTATYRIDTEVIKKMNRILTNLERKANNLERKFNLNRSLSLNYKNHKNSECCCGHAVATVPGGGPLPLAMQCCNNNLHNHQNNNNSVSVHNSLNMRSRLSLTKDEKTDKNINRRRQIHDVSQTTTVASSESSCCGQDHQLLPVGPQIILTPSANPPPATAATVTGGGGRHRRQLGNRSIRRRHTVGGTHDYYSNKMGHNGSQCQQQQQLQQQNVTAGRGGTTVGCVGAVQQQQAVCGGDDKGCKDLE